RGPQSVYYSFVWFTTLLLFFHLLSLAYSSMEVADRLTYLEQRVQMQEDEIQLLKLALEDVLKRLNISEEQSTVFTKRGPVPGISHTQY
uniref:Uncharacterized protein n=1 Tax=Electrophorus electricus TaxID=8005 RepID=A0A4W4FN73_ELEEL